MKKVFFLLIVSCFSSSVFASSGSIKRSNEKFSLISFLNSGYCKKAICVLNGKQPFCRACCTISVTNSNGTQTITQEACVRNSDCTTAATSACDVARLAAAVRAFQ